VLGHDVSARRRDGQWFHLYLILDIYSRKIVGWEVHDSDDSAHAAHLVRRTALAEGIATLPAKPVLHGDNGATLKATTVLAMLYWLGVKPTYSRPRVSFVDLMDARTLGEQLLALVQRRSSSQRHPLRQPSAAPCRRRPRDPRGTTCALRAGARTHTQLDADRRRHAQPGTRLGGRDGHPLPKIFSHWLHDRGDNYLDARRTTQGGCV
jgi:Integrase core domain